MIEIRRAPAIALALLGLSLAITARWASWPSTMVDLPHTSGGGLAFTIGWLKVHLTSDGELIYESRRVTLEELQQQLEAQAGPLMDPHCEQSGLWRDRRLVTTRPILLCIDRAALAVHAAWLLDAVGNAGFNEVYVGVSRVDGPAVLHVPITSMWWWPEAPPYDEDNYHYERQEGFYLGALPNGRFKFDEHEANDPDDFVPVLSEWRNRFRRYHNDEPLISVFAYTKLRFDAMLEAYVAAKRAFVHVEWGYDICHPWIRRQRRLPAPGEEYNYLIGEASIGSSFTWKVFPWASFLMKRGPLSTLPVPLADAAVHDPPSGVHDRFLVEIGDDSQVRYRDKARTLEELATLLADELRRRRERRRARGRRIDPDHPRLRVVLASHKDVPWQHVAWLLAAMASADITNIRIVCLKLPDARYDAVECQRTGVKPRATVPRHPHSLEHKLMLSLRRPASAAKLVVGSDDYALGERKTADALDLRRWLKESSGTVLISALPAVPFKFVVAAANQVVHAGREFRLDYGELPPPR